MCEELQAESKSTTIFKVFHLNWKCQEDVGSFRVRVHEFLSHYYILLASIWRRILKIRRENRTELSVQCFLYTVVDRDMNHNEMHRYDTTEKISFIINHRKSQKLKSFISRKCLCINDILQNRSTTHINPRDNLTVQKNNIASLT